MKGFVKGLFLFTLGLLAGATLVDSMRERTSERTQRMFVAMDVQRAKDLAARGDLAGAKEAWIRANLLHPDSFEAHLGLGFFHECAGEWDSAVRQYERAIEVYPKAAGVDLYAPQPDALALAHARLGRSAKHAGDKDASRRAFERATSIGASARAKTGPAVPDSAQAWLDFLARLDRHCPEQPGAPAREREHPASAPSDPPPGGTR